jgi:hypothetical protein
LKAWSWLKGGLLEGHVQFNVECDLAQYENKVKTTRGIHAWKILGENNIGGV